MTSPKQGENAEFVTQAWNTGPEGDVDPERTIADIVTSSDVKQGQKKPLRQQPVAKQKLPTSRPDTTPVVQRQRNFSQVSPSSQDPDSSVFYFVTVAGQKPAAYAMNAPPNIVVHQGDVEDWTVENRSAEDHVFHVHQIHFKVLAVDGEPVNDPALRDTVDVPYWSGDGHYPSVKLRMDFRNSNTVGTFLYHCHILKHEDMGMMGSIQVLPRGFATTVKLSGPSRARSATLVPFTAELSLGGNRQSPTGTVQFAIDGIGAGRPVSLTNGRAQFTTSFEESGTHVLTASYSGDSKYDEALSTPFKITVGR